MGPKFFLRPGYAPAHFCVNDFLCLLKWNLKLALVGVLFAELYLQRFQIFTQVIFYFHSFFKVCCQLYKNVENSMIKWQIFEDQQGQQHQIQTFKALHLIFKGVESSHVAISKPKPCVWSLLSHFSYRVSSQSGQYVQRTYCGWDGRKLPWVVCTALDVISVASLSRRKGYWHITPSTCYDNYLFGGFMTSW